MQKLLKIISITFLFSSPLFSQSTIDFNQLKEDFRKATNDSIFITSHSATPFQVYQTDKTQPYDSNDVLIKELFKSSQGAVIGPFKKGNTTNFFKITAFEKSYKVHAGIIWIKYKEGRSEEEMAELANHIFSEIKKGKDFSSFCRLYSDDNNSRKNCDVGWLFSNKIPPPLSEELPKHKKNDLFMSHTKYGYHIVKVLDEPIAEKVKVQFVKLSMK